MTWLSQFHILIVLTILSADTNHGVVCCDTPPSILVLSYKARDHILHPCSTTGLDYRFICSNLQIVRKSRENKELGVNNITIFMV